jgi:hypothetical protein
MPADNPSRGNGSVIIVVPPQVEAMIEALLETGLYGRSVAECSLNLILDQLKVVALHDGPLRAWLQERQAVAEALDSAEAEYQASMAGPEAQPPQPARAAETFLGGALPCAMHPEQTSRRRLLPGSRLPLSASG